MILYIHGQAGGIDESKSRCRNFHSIASGLNTRKGVQSGMVRDCAAGGVTVNVDQLYPSTGYAEPGWIHDLARDGRGLRLRQGRAHSEGDKQQIKAKFFHGSKGEMNHWFGFLYTCMRAGWKFFAQENVYGRDIRR